MDCLWSKFGPLLPKRLAEQFQNLLQLVRFLEKALRDDVVELHRLQGQCDATQVALAPCIVTTAFRSTAVNFCFLATTELPAGLTTRGRLPETVIAEWLST
jgi:hypothetical protein